VTTGPAFTRLRSVRLAGADLLRRNVPILLSYLVVILLFVAGTAKTSGFASGSHIRVLLLQASFIGMIGLGQTMCILTGGIDLSVPWVFTGAAVLTSIKAGGDASRLPEVLLLVLALAILVGLFNGIGVAYAGVPPIIMTLGTNGALQGLLLVYTNGGISSFPPQQLNSWVLDTTVGIPNLLWIWSAFFLVGVVLLSGTTLGRRLYGIGTNRSAAYFAGVNVRRTLVLPYVFSAVGAAGAGVLYMGYNGQAFLSMGDPYLFASAAAVAVGGASILGGNGHYVGTVAGALVLTLLSALLVLFNLGTGYLLISYGAVLLIAVFIANVKLLRR
jgi:ribose transport system permease protein